MLTFPDFLNFGKEIANGIDVLFEWFRLLFGWLFEAIRQVILSLNNLFSYILTDTPWFIWLLLFVMFYLLPRFISKKKTWYAMLTVFILWILLYNTIILNPSINLNLGPTETPWWIYVILLFLVTKYLYQVKTALALSSLLLLIGLFGVWYEMMSTVVIILIAVFISFIIGIPLGILMAKSKRVEKTLKPILDMMQTIPSFVYLIPAVMLFSIGNVPATFATIIYAVPPLIRLTFLGIKNVNAEMVEAATSFGSTKMQMLFKIELPQALSTIATGLNQTTMMAVAMVVIASMIGAGGLGAIVLVANRQIDIGAGFVGGFAIVFLAIILDRLLQGIALKLEDKRGEQ